MDTTANPSPMLLRAAAGDADGLLDLARSDPSIDWAQQARYVNACGLARPIASSLPSDASTLPSPFGRAIRAVRDRARSDVFRQLTQRSLLGRIDRILAEASARGVVLKGGACLALTAADAAPPCRATGDLDLYVEPARAAELRARLLDAGFEGERDAPRVAPHHLSPVSLQGIEVEVHTRLMPEFWGLPEGEMLADLRPVPGLERITALGPEGFVLHAVVHATAHLFAFGLKTAWDIAWAAREHSRLDWDRLAAWASATRLPRAFWVPLGVLCDALELSVPPEVLRGAPTDARERRLETFARMRLLRDATGAYELNPFSKNVVFLSLHDSWPGRLGYLASLRGAEATEARASARENESAQAVSRLPSHLRAAVRDWRSYRRALGQGRSAPGS